MLSIECRPHIEMDLRGPQREVCVTGAVDDSGWLRFFVHIYWLGFADAERRARRNLLR
jgi:hypothetical protein